MPTIKATHMLVWVPPGILDSADLWVLHEAFDPEPDDAVDYAVMSSRGGTDLDPGVLVTRVTDHLGYPVHLGPQQERRMRKRWFWGTISTAWRSVPMYYVFPGER